VHKGALKIVLKKTGLRLEINEKNKIETQNIQSIVVTFGTE
jgi:hypothetical protein